jgi:hypothetical protein
MACPTVTFTFTRTLVAGTVVGQGNSRYTRSTTDASEFEARQDRHFLYSTASKIIHLHIQRLQDGEGFKVTTHSHLITRLRILHRMVLN